jgi:hypothetical protein
MQAIKKWAYNASGFNQYGLYHDDVLHESEEVKVKPVGAITYRYPLLIFVQ